MTHEDPHIRCDAVKALGMLADRGDPDAVHASVAGLADEDGNVRRASVDSVSNTITLSYLTIATAWSFVKTCAKRPDG